METAIGFFPRCRRSRRCGVLSNAPGTRRSIEHSPAFIVLVSLNDRADSPWPRRFSRSGRGLHLCCVRPGQIANGYSTKTSGQGFTGLEKVLERIEGPGINRLGDEYGSQSTDAVRRTPTVTAQIPLSAPAADCAAKTYGATRRLSNWMRFHSVPRANMPCVCVVSFIEATEVSSTSASMRLP